MKKKILAMIMSFAFVLSASLSTSCAQYDDDDYDYDEYEYYDDDDYDGDDGDEEYMLDGDGMVYFEAPQFSIDVLDIVNQERTKHGIAPLELAEDLNEDAMIRAEEITEVFSHTRPDGSSYFSIIDGSYHNVGENIAAGNSTPEAVMDQWMNSPGHRANILNPNFTELGVGYVYEDGTEYGHYWVQLFRRP